MQVISGSKMKEGNDFWVFFENEQQPDAAGAAALRRSARYAPSAQSRSCRCAVAADALLALPNLDEKTRQALAKDFTEQERVLREVRAPVVDAVRE